MPVIVRQPKTLKSCASLGGGLGGKAAAAGAVGGHAKFHPLAHGQGCDSGQCMCDPARLEFQHKFRA